MEVKYLGDLIAIIKREKQTNIYNSYIPQEDGVAMLPEELHKQFFEVDNTNRRKTRKNRRGGGRKTRKNKKS